MTAEWKTIDSAPKDGSEVLLAIGGKARVARWHPNQSAGPYRQFPWVCQSSENAWREDVPTHWMPLPSPPNQEGKEK